MKKIVSILLVLCVALNIQATAPAENSDAAMAQTKQLVDKIILRHVFFPHMRLDSTTTVDIVIKVQPDGSLKIVSSNSDNEDARLFVINQLDGITMNKTQVVPGAEFQYQFRFRRQA